MNLASKLAATSAACGIVGVGAQYAFAGDQFFHTWQYAAMLAICAVFATRSAIRGGVFVDPRARGRLLSLGGGLLVIAGGLASGLLGADTQTIVRSPGVVSPVPDVEAAAFFPIVDATSLAQAPPIVIRRRGHPELSVAPGTARYIGASILTAVPHLAAYIDVHDATGNRLTVTQPANTSFLSPLMLFSRTEEIEGKRLPADSFAVPAARRVVRVLYFSPEATANFKSAGAVAGKAAALFAMADDRGGVLPGQIALALSNQEVKLDRLRIRASIATYPALRIASAPHPLPFVLGALAYVAGFGLPLLVRRPLPEPASEVQR